jgi:hypothetical protein
MIDLRILAFILAAGLVWPLSAGADDLKPFTTDGCSSFPDGTIEHASLWANCCIRHDFAYWQGGTYEERLTADEELESCVARAGEPTIASLMLAGVRVGGTPYLPTSYRWGYGWPFLRGYDALTAEDKLQVEKQLELFQIMIKSIAEQLESKNR